MDIRSLNLLLPDRLFAALVNAARRAGQTPSTLAKRLVENGLANDTPAEVMPSRDLDLATSALAEAQAIERVLRTKIADLEASKDVIEPDRYQYEQAKLLEVEAECSKARRKIERLDSDLAAERAAAEQWRELADRRNDDVAALRNRLAEMEMAGSPHRPNADADLPGASELTGVQTRLARGWQSSGWTVSEIAYQLDRSVEDVERALRGKA